MPIIADCHLHTPRCQHALGPLEAYAEQAIRRGLRVIGFADHNPLPRGLGANVRMAETELDDYVAEVLQLRDRFRGQIQVRLGLEMDYIEGLEHYLQQQIERYPWDYILGSVHYLDPDCRHSSWPLNYTGDVRELFRRYFAAIRRLVHSGLCDVVSHFDVVKRSGQSPAEPETQLIEQALEDIARAGLALEINTSGYRHPELSRPEPYPSLEVVDKAVARSIPLMVNSDAHKPEHVGTKFAELEAELLRRGCLTLVHFDHRQRERYALARIFHTPV